MTREQEQTPPPTHNPRPWLHPEIVPALGSIFDCRSPTHKRLVIAIGLGGAPDGYVALDDTNRALANRLATLSISGVMLFIEFGSTSPALVCGRLNIIAMRRSYGDALFLVCNTPAIARRVAQQFEWSDIYLSYVISTGLFSTPRPV